MDINPQFIAPGEKFGLLALEISAVGMPARPQKVGRTHWVAGRPIVDFDDHWREWLGSLRHEDLQDATIFVVDKIPSKAPTILNGESQLLMNRTPQLLTGLLLTGRFAVPREPLLMTGGNEKDKTDIRQVTNLDAHPYVSGLDLHDITFDQVKRAARIADSFADLSEMKGFERLSRILGTFVDARTSIEPLDQLHQFCRCIEGLIIPAAGQSRAKFQSRTQLFIGNKHQQLMAKMYDARSAVEHLNDHLMVLQAGRPERIELIRQSIIAENIARKCLARIHETPALWPHFQSDTALMAFWKLPEDERQKIWGSPFDPEDILVDFDPASIQNHQIALP